MPHARGVAHRVAAAAHAELSGDGRAAPGWPSSTRRRCGCAPGPSRSGSRPARSCRTTRRRWRGRRRRGPLPRPRDRSSTARRPGAVRSRRSRVPREMPRSARPRSKRSRTSASATAQVRAGPHGQVQVGLARERRAARIDHDELRAQLLRALDVRDEVDAGRRRIAAPDDDEPRVFVVGVGDAGHLAVHRRRGRAGRRGAHGARQPRRTEAPEEPRVLELVGEQAVRSAVVEGQHGLGAERVARVRASALRSRRALRPR